MIRPHDAPRVHIAPLTAALALLLGAALLAPARARAEGDPRLEVPGGGVLFAGQQVVLRWQGGTGDVDEMELLLEIEGPGHHTIQISPQLDPQRGVFVWRVPELGRGAHARLVVRYDRDGREVEGRASRRLQVLSERDRPIPPALLPEPATDEAAGRGSSAERAGTRAGESETSASMSTRARASSRAVSGSTSSSLASAARAADSRSHTAPAFVPSRN